MSWMNSRSTAPIACAIAAVITTGVGRAHALSCAEPGVSVPYHEAVQVPTNTLVWCTKRAENPLSTIRLRDPWGVDVSGTQTQLAIPYNDIIVFHPDAELAPNSEYTVDCPLRYDVQPSTTFTTGSGPRTTPPAVPDVSNVVSAVNPDGGWGPSHFARLVGAGQGETIVVVDVVSGSSTLNPEAPSGAIADAQWLFQTSDIYVGSGPCGGNWPAAKLGASTTVALGAFDLTGAFSGWSDAVTVTLDSEYPAPEQGEPDPTNGKTPPENDGPSEDDDVGDVEADDASHDATNVSVTDPVGGTDSVSPNAADDSIAPNATGDAPVRPSPMGRSGCALVARPSSVGAGALFLALAGLFARRRKAT